MQVFIVIYQAIFSRMAGGGIWPNRPAQMSEILFSLPIGILVGLAMGFWCGIGCFLWSYACMQTGHGTAFRMGADPASAQSGRKEKISFVVDPLCKLFNQPLGGDFYCWLFMGIKGLLIHLPLGLPSIAAVLLWPLAYFIGNRIVFKHTSFDGNVVAEILAGAFSGLIIAYKMGILL